MKTFQLLRISSQTGVEAVAAVILFLLGVGSRIALITVFPTEPVSDFRGIVNFALAFRDSGLTAGGWYWDFFNPGLPTILSFLFHIIPGNPQTIARVATALFTGIIPLIPFFIWRGIVSLKTRLLVGLLLAAWPSQVLFSGVVAQDNWILPPTIALASLATRVLLSEKNGYPVWAATLLCLTGYLRQEMLIVLLPLSAVAAGFSCRRNGYWKGIGVWCTATLLLLTAIAGQRYAATGRFTLTSEHAGLAMLGSYVPGAGLEWVDPRAHVSAVAPALLEDEQQLRQQAPRLALSEVVARPLFHMVRRIVAILVSMSPHHGSLFYWSFTAQGALAPELISSAQRLFLEIKPIYIGWIFVIYSLFVGAFLLAVQIHYWPILLTSTSIALKIGIHFIFVTQSRFFLVVTALMMLVVCLMLEQVWRQKASVRNLFLYSGIGFLIVGFVSTILPFGITYVAARDWPDRQYSYHFSLYAQNRQVTLNCVIETGALAYLSTHIATLRFLERDPLNGQTAEAKCNLKSDGIVEHVSLMINDPYALGGLPDRVVQRVMVDGREVFLKDIAATTGEGWATIPLGNIDSQHVHSVSIQLIALRPDPGMGWGLATATQIKLLVDKSNSASSKASTQ